MVGGRDRECGSFSYAQKSNCHPVGIHIFNSFQKTEIQHKSTTATDRQIDTHMHTYTLSLQNDIYYPTLIWKSYHTFSYAEPNENNYLKLM